MRRKSGAAVGRRIIAFQQHDFVGFHRRQMEPAMRGIAGDVINAYCGSPTIFIDGRGRGEVASKRLDDDLRSFTFSVELKVVNFAGN